MFRCCLSDSRRSGLKKAQSENLFRRCRHWLSRQSRRIWLFCRRHRKNSNQETIEHLAGGFNYSISIDKGQRHRDTNKGQHGSWCEKESILCLDKTCTMQTLQEGTIQRLESLVPAYPSENISYITIFLDPYQAFTSCQQILDHIFNRYRCTFPCSDVEEGTEEQLKMALSPILRTWPNQYLQEDWQNLWHPWLKLRVAYTHAGLTGFDLKCCDPLSTVHLEHLVPIEAEKEVPAPVPQPAAKTEPGPTLDLELVPALCLPSPLVMEPPSTHPVLEHEEISALTQRPNSEPESAGPSAIGRISSPPLKVVTEPAPASEASCPWQVTRKTAKEKPDLKAFPPQLVAEQLTIIDAELFKKVVPRHCLGSTWSQRNKPGNEHLAPTVRATINHVQSVTRCVTTTCLGDPSMTAQDRARVVEYWIQVAQECQILRNYSSLRAILSALQNASIGGLGNTWREISRKSYNNFRKLQFQDKSPSRDLMIREASSKFVRQEINTKKTQERQQQQKGFVPYLRTFLNDLAMLHLTRRDYLKGGEINLRKRNEENEVMREILLLQAAAHNYNLNPEEQFRAWFRDMERLTEKESYILSCQLEPRS